jgi:hypothetical protein
METIESYGFNGSDSALLKEVFENKITKVVDGVQVKWIESEEK